jgi:iron complex transport system substrate-binding protein
LVKTTLASSFSVYELFSDVLERLSPTHILTQSQCRVCAVSLDDVQQTLSGQFSFHPTVVALEPNSLADIWNDIRRVAKACGVETRGEEVIATLARRMQEISTVAGNARHRPRVACIEWLEPLMACGNWVPELVEMAGGENLFGSAGAHSPWMSWEDLVASEPDIIVAMPCGFDLQRTRQETYWLTNRPEWKALRAARNGRVYLGDGNQYLNRPGPRVVESLQILAEIFHPEQYPPRLEGVGWQKL